MSDDGLGRRVAGATLSAVAAASLALAAPAIAQERQYELVTPADDRFYNAAFRSADPDMNQIHYYVGGSSGSPAPALSDGAMPDGFGAARTAQGWQTSWLTPYCPGKFSVHDPGTCGDESEADGPRSWVASGNGRIIFTTQAPVAPGKPGWGLAPGSPNPTREIYAGDAQTTSQLGWEPMPAPDGWGSGVSDDTWVATSPDQSTLAFASADVRAPEAAGLPAGTHLYVRRGTTLHLASPAIGGASGGDCGSDPCQVRIGGPFHSEYWQSPALTHAVSDDGQRVFFATNRRLHPDTMSGDPMGIYVFDGEQLRLLSKGLNVGTSALNGGRFEWAAANGSRAFFRDAGNRIWAVDVPSEPSVTANRPEDLTAITPAGATSQLIWASDDGSTAMVSSPVSFAGAPAGTERKLYVWREGGGTSYVGPLVNGDSLLSTFPAARDVRGTADGSTIVFGTKAALDPADTNGAADLYRLAGATLTWLTPRSGAAATGDIAVSMYLGQRGIGGEFFTLTPRGLTADLQTVFFTTTAALSPEDTDGGKEDVYSVRDGEYTLITPPGDAQEDAWLNENSPDGSIVLFTTRAKVTEVDIDQGMADIYSARTSGAFVDKLPPVTTGVPAPSGGPAVPAPVPTEPSSQPKPVEPVPVVPEWPADPADPGGDGPSGGELGVEDEPVFGRRRAAVTLSLPGAGEARVVLKGRVGKRVRTLGRGSRSVARGGERTVRVRLTRHGRRFDGGRVAVRVAFTGEDGERMRLRERLHLERPEDRAAGRREARDA